MKKIIFTLLCALATTSHIHAMLSKPVHNDNFHGQLLNKQIQNMIVHNRADELKLWLDQSSHKWVFQMPMIASLQVLAHQHNAPECEKTLLQFMQKISK